MSEYNYCANCANAESRKFYVHPCPSCVHGNKEWFELADGREPPPVYEWISVKDRLPGICEKVLVYGRGKMRIIKVDMVLEKNREPVLYKYITHWMPLPAPPTPCNEDRGGQ